MALALALALARAELFDAGIHGLVWRGGTVHRMADGATKAELLVSTADASHNAVQTAAVTGNDNLCFPCACGRGRPSLAAAAAAAAA